MKEQNRSTEYFESLQTVVQAAASALVVFDKNGLIKFCNEAVKHLFGFKPENLIGRHINKLLAPDLHTKHTKYFKEFFRNSQNRAMGGGNSFPAIHKSGKQVYVSIGLTQLEFKGEHCVLATITKAGKLNMATQSLHRSRANLAKRIEENKKLLNVAENSRDAVFLLDNTGRITWVNKASYLLIGNSEQKVLNVPVVQLFLHGKNKLARSQLKKSIDNGLSFTGEVDYTNENAEKIELYVNLQPVFEADTLVGFLFNVRDVSHRKRLELQMRETNELLETTARMAKLGFYTVDIQTNHLTWSEEVYKIHDLPVNISIDVQSALQYYAPEARPVIQEAVKRCMDTGESFDLELPFITAKNRHIWVRAVGYAEFKSGKPTKLKGAFQDITNMREAAKAAEQAARTKSNFLANMSHELRTPISGVLGISELLQKTRLDSKQDEYVKVVSQSASTLLFLVNQILDYAKLDSGSQSLDQSYFNIKQFVHEKTYIHAVAAKNNGVGFRVEISENVPDKIYLDQHRLAQIVNNLCSNAVKFTREGEIVVALEILQDDSLKISVKDTGIGIKESDLDKLFVEFQQVDNSFSREYQGTGLGLSITRQLATLMQGKVEMSSVFGEGSHFWLTLPLPANNITDFDQSSSIKLPNTLLLVNDITASDSWLEIAQKQKSKIRAFANVSEFLAALKSDQHWQLVVIVDPVDNLPIETVCQSVSRLLNNKQTLLINSALKKTGNATKLPESIDLYPAKPLSVIKKGMWQCRQIKSWLASGPKLLTQQLSGKRLLIAEDNSINQMLFENMLAELDVDITMVANGQQALDALNAVEKESPFDLVIMDCQMPVIDGFETTKLIRAHQNKNISGLRIVAATAHGFSEDIQKCYDMGMNDVIVKPFSTDQLTTIILRNL